MKHKTSKYSFGYYIAILTVILTLVTFGIAIFTPPLSGPFCKNSCIEYPYTDILSRFPRDYIWMYPAILLSIIYILLMVCIHHYAPKKKKLYSQAGLSFAIVSAMTLFLDYFVQLSVIQPSLLKGETEGIAILSQYNPHGIFIALEEAGYLIMSLSFFILFPVFSGKNSLEKAIRYTFIGGFILVIVSLILVSIVHGIEREYLFEVIFISIDWIVLIISGILLARLFRREMKKT